MHTALTADLSPSVLRSMREQEHLTNKEIAQRLDVSVATINKYLPSDEKHKNYHRMTQSDISFMKEMYKQGMKITDIAAKMNVSVPTVSKWLESEGLRIVVPRPRKSQYPVTVTIPNHMPDEEQPEEEPEKIFRHCKKTVQVGVFEGRLGEYYVGMQHGKVMLPTIPKFLSKEEIGYLIRDLQTLWQEV